MNLAVMSISSLKADIITRHTPDNYTIGQVAAPTTTTVLLRLLITGIERYGI
jgi:hypothetical protein